MAPIVADISPNHRIGVLRCALTGAASLAVLFFLCWVGAVLFPTIVSHMFVALFTGAIFTTLAALLQGLCSSAIFGALAGSVVAIFYNIFAAAEPNN